MPTVARHPDGFVHVHYAERDPAPGAAAPFDGLRSMVAPEDRLLVLVTFATGVSLPLDQRLALISFTLQERHRIRMALVDPSDPAWLDAWALATGVDVRPFKDEAPAREWLQQAASERLTSGSRVPRH